jgi:hypothetical protein
VLLLIALCQGFATTKTSNVHTPVRAGACMVDGSTLTPSCPEVLRLESDTDCVGATLIICRVSSVSIAGALPDALGFRCCLCLPYMLFSIQFAGHAVICDDRLRVL